MLAHPEINGVTLASDRLGANIRQNSFVADLQDQKLAFDANILRVDEDFLEVYQANMQKGRFFSKAFGTDSLNSFVINETLAAQLGDSLIVGKDISITGGSQGKIIGVVKDFHFHSLYQSLDPLVMQFRPEASREMTLKISGHNISKTLEFLEKTWANIGTSRPFQPIFLDRHIASLYESDVLTSKIITLIAVLVILIATLGFLGLAALRMESRLKEISIRRVLGASMGHILMILSMDFLQMVLTSFVLAIPVSLVLINIWLEQFAFRIQIGFSVFAYAGLMASLVALGTILFRAWGTLKANPATILKND